MSWISGQLLQATGNSTAKSVGHRAVSSSGALLTTDFAVTLSGSSLAITLPLLSTTADGFILIIKNDEEHTTNTVAPFSGNGSSRDVSHWRFSGNDIDGSTSPLSLANANSCVFLMGDGAGHWRIISRIT